MKKIILVTLIAICAFQYSHSASILKKVNTEKHIYASLDSIDRKKQTLNRVSIKEFLVLKILQRKIRRHLKKNGAIDISILYNKDKKPFKWHWGGFILGLLLPFGLGMIICSLNKNGRRSDRVISAAIGTSITSLVLVFIQIRALAP